MSEPHTVTIDFRGLCAFIGDEPRPKHRIEVVLVAAETVVAGLCRHDPVLVFGKRHFETIGPQRDRMVSFTNANGQDIGTWDLRGRRLMVGGAGGDLHVDYDSYGDILGLRSLAADGAEVHGDWLKSPGMGAHLTIDRGEVSAWDRSDPWYLVRQNGQPQSDSVRFLRVVRWKVPVDRDTGFLRLATAVDEWIDFRPGAHLTICNLCPLDEWEPPYAKDVLAYYEFSKYKDHIPPQDRYVLYRDDREADGSERPGVDACPPLTGYLAD